MECMTRTNRRGADPPKDESGMTGDVYGICLAAKTFFQLPTGKVQIDFRGNAGQTSSVSLMGVSGVQ